MKRIQLADYRARHFGYQVDGKVATITLNRPDRKNPLTFDSYGELRDLFREMVYATDIKSVVFAGSGGNFCSGGDVRDIIGPLLERDMKGLLEFTRMTGDLVKAIRACPQPVIAAIDGFAQIHTPEEIVIFLGDRAQLRVRLKILQVGFDQGVAVLQHVHERVFARDGAVDHLVHGGWSRS